MSAAYVKFKSFIFDAAVHCGKYTSSFRGRGCAATHSGSETGLESCWNRCSRAAFYNMIWIPQFQNPNNPVMDDSCGCVNSKNDPDSCGEGEYEYYNANPADCIPGTLEKHI